MFYVYRFLDKDLKVIYIGRTVDIKARMTQHFGNGGHLPKECYESVHRVDFLEFKTKNDMKIKELYYIGKYRPKYNTADNSAVSFVMDEIQDVWVTYSKENIGKRLFGDSDELEKMERFVEYLKTENDKLIEANRLKDMGCQEMRKEVSRLKQELSNRLSDGRVVVNVQNQKVQGNERQKLFTKLYSYKKVQKIMNLEPRLFSICEIDGEFSFLLRKEGDEILVDVGFKEGNIRTIVMATPNRKREWKFIDKIDESDFSALQPTMEVFGIQHWKLQWRHKPYKKGA